MNNPKAKVDLFVDRLVQEAMTSGLTWNEAACAFGRAASALAVVTARSSDRNVDASIAHAREIFEEAFTRPVQVIIARPDMERLHETYQTMTLSATEIDAISQNVDGHLIMRHQ